MRSATGMTDNQCEVKSEVCGLRGGRQLTTTRVTKQVNTGRSWMGQWTGEVPVGFGSYQGGPGFMSLRGARFLADARNRLGNLDREQDEIATTRLAGARNDERAWCWMKEAATESWRRDLQTPVSSLVLWAVDRMTISTRGAFSTGRVRVGRGQPRNTSNISGVELGQK